MKVSCIGIALISFFLSFSLQAHAGCAGMWCKDQDEIRIAEIDARTGCTQMWCQEGLNVNITGTEWPVGRYDFSFYADGRTINCTSRLPFKDCENNTTCDSEGVMIGESGCALPPEMHSFYGIMMEKPPQALGFVIRHESGKIFSYETAVHPKCFYPNGEQCDLHPCCSAVLDVPLKWE